ncbi:hypothetical protein [Nonomuraea sp. NPDC049141]|uniref:hypothetical protein n=1 Tax=Nonomuraea sp. NPDC049141 TaxID=3155500 RepID=UPI0033DA0667
MLVKALPLVGSARAQRRRAVSHPGVAPRLQGKTTAADLGACLFFEDEAGQGLRPLKGCTWAPVGSRPVVTVRGKGSGRVNMAAVVACRIGERPHLFYRLRIYRGRKGEPKSFSWIDYRDLITATSSTWTRRSSGVGTT